MKLRRLLEDATNTFSVAVSVAGYEAGFLDGCTELEKLWALLGTSFGQKTHISELVEQKQVKGPLKMFTCATFYCSRWASDGHPTENSYLCFR